MYLFTENKIIKTDILVDMFYTEDANIEIHCLEKPGWIEDTKEAISHMLVSCQDALGLKIYSRIKYMPKVQSYQSIAFGGAKKYIKGCFISIAYEGQSPQKIITNAPNFEVFFGCCAIISNTILLKSIENNAQERSYIETACHYLESKLFENKNMGEETETVLTCGNFAVSLFRSGILAVTCQSEEEYTEFRDWLINSKYVISETVNPLGWDSIYKYIIYDKAKNIVYATHWLSSEIDNIISSRKLTRIPS